MLSHYAVVSGLMSVRWSLLIICVGSIAALFAGRYAASAHGYWVAAIRSKTYQPFLATSWPMLPLTIARERNRTSRTCLGTRLRKGSL